MHVDQQVIDLATGIQRRRDFTAHTTGFAAGAVIVGSLTLAGVRGGRLYAATLLTWATALSFQHFRHVLRGPVTADAVRAEAARRSRGSGSGTQHDPAGRPDSAAGPTPPDDQGAPRRTAARKVGNPPGGTGRQQGRRGAHRPGSPAG